MDEWTPKEEWQPAFLKNLADGWAPRQAAIKAGTSRSNAYLFKKRDEGFSAAWDEAVQESIDDDEDSLRCRGRDGDTTALLARLRAYRKPYREGAAAGAAQIQAPAINITYQLAPDEQPPVGGAPTGAGAAPS